jgi:hypothetical protein
LAKKLAFLTQNKAKLCKILIMTLVFEKNANFFAKNCLKSQKIVIRTSRSLVTLAGGSNTDAALHAMSAEWCLFLRRLPSEDGHLEFHPIKRVRQRGRRHVKTFFKHF